VLNTIPSALPIPNHDPKPMGITNLWLAGQSAACQPLQRSPVMDEISYVHNVCHSQPQSRFQRLFCSVAAVFGGRCLSVPKAMEE